MSVPSSNPVQGLNPGDVENTGGYRGQGLDPDDVENNGGFRGQSANGLNGGNCINGMDYKNGMNGTNGSALNRSNSLSIDPDVFEKLFLNPKTQVHGQLRSTFGIPTPLGLIGFGIALSPLSACLMGWRGSNNMLMGVADIGAYLWFGGLLVLVSSILEFFLGNTFSFVLFGGYGAWFLTYAATLQPFYNAAGAYAATPGTTPGATTTAGQLTSGYTASFGFEIVFMAVLTFIFFILSFRVNLIFVLLIFSNLMGFCLVASALFVESEAIRSLTSAAAANTGANANPTLATELLNHGEMRIKVAKRLVVGGGAAFFATSCFIWYLVLAIMLAIVDFPLLIGVFDLSTIVIGKSEKMAIIKAKKGEAEKVD